MLQWPTAAARGAGATADRLRLPRAHGAAFGELCHLDADAGEVLGTTPPRRADARALARTLLIDATPPVVHVLARPRVGTAVACVADAVRLLVGGIRLVLVGDPRAVIRLVRKPVPVEVGIADVAPSVPIEIALQGIRNPRTVVVAAGRPPAAAAPVPHPTAAVAVVGNTVAVEVARLRIEPSAGRLPRQHLHGTAFPCRDGPGGPEPSRVAGHTRAIGGLVAPARGSAGRPLARAPLADAAAVGRHRETQLLVLPGNILERPGAEIAGVTDPVVVLVLLRGVGGETAIVALVADPVPVAVTLGRVGHGGTPIAVVGDPVTVGIEGARDRKRAPRQKQHEEHRRSQGHARRGAFGVPG